MKRNLNKFSTAVLGLCILVFINGCMDGELKIRSADKNSRWYISCAEECDPREASPFFDHEDFKLRLRKAGEVSSILEKLGESRDNLLKTGDFIELFPTIYFHTTKNEFEKVLANKSNNPIDKLDMIISFYDAYRFNRESFESGGAKAVEKHWRKYYTKAVAANNSSELTDKYDKMSEIMFVGVDAHLVYDIPRFVRVFSLKHPKRIAELKSEFNDIDTILVDAAQKANSDIFKVLGTKEDAQMAVNMFKTGASYIILARKKSWDLGVSSEPLLTKKPQPVLSHDFRSRAYFPQEILRSGVCRKTHLKDRCEFAGYRRFVLEK